MKEGAVEAAGVQPNSKHSNGAVQWVMNRRLSLVDFILRLLAAAGTLASAVVTGTTDQTLPFFTQFLQFTAEYNDIPTFT
jgi:hypothetical protein